MVGAKIPGCSGCGKTGHGGRQLNVNVEGSADRYEVRKDGQPIGRFKSIVAASTFMTGKPGATVHTVTPGSSGADTA